MLVAQNITFTYIEKAVIKGLNFSVQKGQNVAIIGESGCGKSTLLKLIYGLYNLDSGQIFYNDAEVLGPSHNLIPGVENMKYLAQDFDLMPYITVEENVGKYLSNIYPEQKKERVDELLAMVEMTEFAQVKAKYLSGGQQQRVALARVLALEPDLLLLDEPFSQIDAFRKNALRRNLFRYLKHKGITCIIATHDSTDALSFSDETIVMQKGEIVRQGDSKEIYHNPQTKYVASLFGEVNELLHSDLFDLEEKDTDAAILVYPHQLQLDLEGKLAVTVKQCLFKGSHYLIVAAYQKKPLFFDCPFEIEHNTDVRLSLL
ncbi:ABC transporter ATP-binding protein [Flavobacterium agrisoli]|uniref:ABC transporter ATP-binding protein n=1 Tax=Flavobacterium agrisoli TaxID=2793066 RepID=A0A934PPN4_9FLAO|nr:ABC transporter ATP-binding protein [Flavobacterium agrisoli]MBK0370793.1 ABC transporter ATP-binding protein [Flavobacterium agrisoli]